MDVKQCARLGWIRLYEEVKEAGLVCRRCGIYRPALRKWLRRYQDHGEFGLLVQSRRPHSSPERFPAMVIIAAAAGVSGCVENGFEDGVTAVYRQAENTKVKQDGYAKLTSAGRSRQSNPWFSPGCARRRPQRPFPRIKSPWLLLKGRPTSGVS